jgi:hypothetical protein
MESWRGNHGGMLGGIMGGELWMRNDEEAS